MLPARPLSRTIRATSNSSTLQVPMMDCAAACGKERLRIELARIKAQGWAISEQQLELGYRGGSAGATGAAGNGAGDAQPHLR